MSGSTSLRRRLSRHFLAFGIVVATILGGLGIWGATAPIASAAIAGGHISPAGLRMTVQHLEGGIVSEVVVQEGETVVAGQPLVVLDRTRVEASLIYDQRQMVRLQVMKVRLDAHQANSPILTIPQELIDAGAGDPEYDDFIATQRALFVGERLRFENQVEVLEAQMQQLEAEIEGRRQEIAGVDEQLVLVDDELERLRPLLTRGLVERGQITMLERQESEYNLRRATAVSLLSQGEQRIAQVQLNLSNAAPEFQRIVADQLSRLNLELSQLRERVRSGQDIVDRTVIRAPAAGTVVDLQVNTPNAVIGAGQPLLDIVPSDAKLVVNARLSPIDIDTVHVGLDVDIHVLSFVARSTLPLRGQVTKVSADALVDPATGAAYYAVEIAMNEDALSSAQRDMLVSGMPVEVFIFTGNRTFLEYLAQPVLASFRRSFRDS